MSQAQSLLVFGGMLNFFVGALAAFAMYWGRVRRPEQPSPKFALLTHRGTLMNGVFLLGLAVAIDHTNLGPTVPVLFAAAEVVVTLLSDGRNILNWVEGIENDFAQVPMWRVRLRGVGDVVHLVVISGVLYGVTRTALGWW